MKKNEEQNNESKTKEESNPNEQTALILPKKEEISVFIPQVTSTPGTTFTRRTAGFSLLGTGTFFLFGSPMMSALIPIAQQCYNSLPLTSPTPRSTAQPTTVTATDPADMCWQEMSVRGAQQAASLLGGGLYAWASFLLGKKGSPEARRAARTMLALSIAADANNVLSDLPSHTAQPISAPGDTRLWPIYTAGVKLGIVFLSAIVDCVRERTAWCQPANVYQQR